MSNYVSIAGLYATTHQIESLLSEISEVQPNNKVYFHNKKLYRDIVSIYQPMIRFFHIRSRIQTIKGINEILDQYLTLVNYILILEIDDEKMIKLHCKLICGWIYGLKNLIITYNEDHTFAHVMNYIILSLTRIYNKLEHKLLLINEGNFH
jgi:hypothetical protein